MKTDNNTLILMGAVGLAVFAIMKGKSKGKKYFVPGLGYVEESRLPDYGYVKLNGQWYSQAQIDAAAAAAGVVPGQNVTPGSQTWSDVMYYLNLAMGLLPLVYTGVQTIITAAERPAKIQEILFKYTNINSLQYDATFPYSQSDLEAMTNVELAKVFDTGRKN